MKRMALATLGLVALAVVPAAAADLGPTRMPTKAPVIAAPIVYNWSGFYIGAHVGGGWSDKSWGHCHGAYGCGYEPTSVDPSGFLAGVQAGFNWQVNQWVFGVEGQISWADLNNDTVHAWGPNYRAYSDVNMIATLAGRFGFAFDRTLLYVKGGVAWADEDHWMRYNGTVLDWTNKAGETRTGWMVGIGAEYAFGNNWSAKLEYNYMDFGDDIRRLTWVGGGWDDFAIDQQIHVVKFGVNYRFGGPVVARY